MGPRAILVGLAVLASSTALAQGSKAEPSPTTSSPVVDLTGYWRLDPDLSDGADPRGRGATRALQSDHGPRRPPGAHPGKGDSPWDRDEAPAPTGPGVDVMTPGMVGTGETDDPFRRGGSSRSSSSPARSVSAYVRDLPETLAIAQRPSLILIQEDDDEGRTRALRPDGVRHRAVNGESEHRTRWDKGLLHVETWHDDGVKVEEIFELAPDGALLTVTVQVAEGGSPVVLERVFRRSRPEAS
jgi:hypothetical protein